MVAPDNSEPTRVNLPGPVAVPPPVPYPDSVPFSLSVPPDPGPPAEWDLRVLGLLRLLESLRENVSIFLSRCDALPGVERGPGYLAAETSLVAVRHQALAAHWALRAAWPAAHAQCAAPPPPGPVSLSLVPRDGGTS